MPEDNKTPVEVPDEMVRRFLLGGLSSSEQPGFEEQLFLDDGLDGRVRRCEFELADDYAYGRLDQAERDLFEKRFLVSADRRRKIEVSTVLRERFAPAPIAKLGVVERLGSLFPATRPAWRLAFGAVLLLILFGTALLVIKEPRLTQRIANTIIPRRRAPRSAPQEAAHPTNDSGPQHQETPSPMPFHDQSSSSIVSVALEAQSGAVPTVSVPKGAQDVVRFQLAVPADQQGPYRAELLTIGGQAMFSAETIQSADRPEASVDFDAPAALLKPGNYQIKLTRENVSATEGVRAYYFRVQ
ncbi:MAG TPA: hypothetical protein VK475_01615 [Pyrinomonadaceae bacterium]|nr:hypothetical protein [Pyrinomonadaceae bacterium]